MMRIGHGFDVHPLVTGRPLIVGGVHIPYEKGLEGHSDADVLFHAVSDALLGAAGLGDMGRYFPDTDVAFQDADSGKLLAQVSNFIKEKGFVCQNVDATILAEAPKMAEYITEMQENVAKMIEIHVNQVNVKATTAEKLGFIGRGEGMAVEAVVLIDELRIRG